MLVDTNVLIRTLQPHQPHYVPANRAIRLLPKRGTILHIVPQNLFEVWVVATRPFGQNGLGMTTVAAASELQRIKAMFSFLPDTRDVHQAWEALVTRYSVAGKPAHDTRLAAAIQVHSLRPS